MLGTTLNVTITRQTILTATELITVEQKQAAESFSATVLQAVRNEDYAPSMKNQS